MGTDWENTGALVLLAALLCLGCVILAAAALAWAALTDKLRGRANSRPTTEERSAPHQLQDL